ncbi:MAG: sigma-70 family RNA polymerase sigma factor, partial [Pseudomonadota bacterium]
PLFVPDPPEQPDRAVSAAERDAAVRKAVTELTDAQREVVRLAYFTGLSQQEIAERLDVPLGTVKSRMRLAGERLRADLGDGFAQELLE